jgi:type I restriction enzyme S subunit
MELKNSQCNHNSRSRWIKVRLGAVCKLMNGYAFKSEKYTDTGIPVVRISDINDGLVTLEDSVFVSGSSAYEPYSIEEGDILVAMSGATTGKFGIYKGKVKAYQNQRVGNFKLLNADILKQFLFFQLHALKRKIEKDAYGGAQPNISSKKIEEMEISLTSVAEQQLIVSKLEELFSELDKGKQQLETALQQLKIYRQAVLKWAFEGKLTNKNVKEGELPNGWMQIKLSTVSDLITKGASPKWQGINYTDDHSQVLFVTSENVRENSIEISEPKYLEIGFNSKQKRSILKKGDVLLNIVGASIGRAAIFDLDVNANINQAVAIIRLNNKVLRKYVCYFLNSNVALSYYNVNKVDFARANLSLADVSNIPMALPPLKEQEYIVQEIESRLSVCDKMEETIINSLKQTETLRQSILKKAFEGKLI